MLGSHSLRNTDSSVIPPLICRTLCLPPLCLPFPFTLGNAGDLGTLQGPKEPWQRCSYVGGCQGDPGPAQGVAPCRPCMRLPRTGSPARPLGTRALPVCVSLCASSRGASRGRLGGTQGWGESGSEGGQRTTPRLREAPGRCIPRVASFPLLRAPGPDGALSPGKQHRRLPAAGPHASGRGR